MNKYIGKTQWRQLRSKRATTLKIASRPIFIGDFKSNTGPAIANKNFKSAIGRRATFSKCTTKLSRIIELLIRIPLARSVCFCSLSKTDIYGIRIAKVFRKRTVYLMHGYTKIEKKLNGYNNGRGEIEDYILRNVDEVVCVSKLLESTIKKDYPKITTTHIYNIINPVDTGRAEKNKKQIMTTGGGMPQKNNLVVCKAIEKIVSGHKGPGPEFKLVIAGKPYNCESNFKKYAFVEYLGNISHEACLEKMRESQLYVQNSSFETFGIAPIEALFCSCELLISEKTGAKEVIDGLDEQHIIHDENDENEIARKIQSIMRDTEKSVLTVKAELVSARNSEKLLKIVEG